LAVHPEAKDPTTRKQLKDAEAIVRRNLKLLDELKPLIKQKYEKYIERLRGREARRNEQDRRTSQDFQEDRSQRNFQQLHAHENKDLAVRLAQKEFARRDALRQANTSAPRDGNDQDDLFRRMQNIRPHIDTRPLVSSSNNSAQNSSASASTKSATFNYPTVPSIRAQQFPNRIPTTTADGHPSSTSDARMPPPLPAKPSRQIEGVIPPRPEKLSDQATSKAGSPEPTYTFAPASYLENGQPLRTLFLPPTMRTTFLRLAYKNTRSNLETCGFLAGTVISNALFVSKLIIPSQKATSDTCEMTDDSQLFDYVDQHDLIVMGWIHTHPTQTCFMSSSDLHTHSGYQMMLAETVAVVCAPSQGDTLHGGDWGVFRLTDPPGKSVILKCRKPGIFHPHEVDNLYTDAVRPAGHVAEAPGLEFEVVDLRE